MSKPSGSIKSIKLPSDSTSHEIVPDKVGSGSFYASLPALTKDATLATTDDIPSVGNAKIIIKQGNTEKGSFTTNQSGDDVTITLDEGSSPTDYISDVILSDGTTESSVVEDNVATIKTTSAYNANSNKVVMQSELATKQGVMYPIFILSTSGTLTSEELSNLNGGSYYISYKQISYYYNDTISGRDGGATINYYMSKLNPYSGSYFTVNNQTGVYNYATYGLLSNNTSYLSNAEVADDKLTITKSNGTTVEFEGGGSTPTNMVTTDTDQTISGAKTFTKNITLKDVGGKTGINIENSTGNTDTYIEATRTDTNVGVRLAVGSGGTNHGIWSNKLNKWMMYADASSVYLNGNASTATKASMITGFSNARTSQTWGNQTGTFIAGADDSTGGAIAFRRDNPKSGQMSMIIDGTVYVNEGNDEVATLATDSVAFAESERQKSKNLVNIVDSSWSIVTGSRSTQSLVFNGSWSGVNETRIGYIEPITLKTGKTYTISFKVKGGTMSSYLNLYLNDSSSGLWGHNIGCGIYQTSTVTMTEDITFDSVRWYVDTNTFDNFEVGIQLEEGSTATDYVEYYGDIVHAGGSIAQPDLTSGVATTSYGVAHIVETYLSSDGLTWYRKWSDGWKECGGIAITSSNATVSITLPLTFSNTNYIVTTGANHSYEKSISFAVTYYNKAVSSLTFMENWAKASQANYATDETFNYYCCGY